MKKKIKIKQGAFLSAFCTELAMIIETGIPVNDGLLMLIDDEENENNKQFLEMLYDETKDGQQFSAAAKIVGGFPQYAIDMFVVGEKTGRLDSVMRSLAIYYDRDAKIKESIKSAVIFPLVLFSLLLVVMWILLTQVLPVFEEVFGQLGLSLNSTAGMLMRVGAFLENFSLVILAVAALIIIASFVIYMTDNLRNSFKRGLAYLLRNSKLMNSIMAARFTSSMAMTLKSGLDIDESLSLALAFAPDKQTAEKINQCKVIVAEGNTFNDAVLTTRILSPLYCRMLALSFKTGSTDEIMELIAEKSEDDVAVNIETLIGRIEPIMAAVMSLFIGLVLLSVMFPLLAVMGV
ncbi:MAG: type II secretion system F family protein [Oscillospiraceae bacterium]|nr:type II secretion system F family protein [Oscillospiraceae bacterium]